MKKDIKLKVFTSQNQLYMEMLLELRDHSCWFFKGENEVFKAPFVLTCAAAFECSLNDNLISYLTDKGEASLINGYLSMNLRGKLSNIVSILTDNNFKINREHKIYLELSELIRLRNILVHNKSTYEECDGVVIVENDDVSVEIPDEVNQKLNDFSFGILGNVGRFHDSLEKLHELFFDSYNTDGFNGNELIVHITPDDRFHLDLEPGT